MKSQNYKMDVEIAKETLQNVFTACDREPNTIPFEKIAIRKHVKTAAVTVALWLSATFLLLCLLSPFCFANSAFRVKGIAHYNIVVENHYLTDNCFTIEFNDADIDYDNILVTDSRGNSKIPDEISRKEHLIRIFDPEGTLNIYIPDTDGHSITAVLTMQNQN